MNWKPINSAPRNKPVLLFRPDAGFSVWGGVYDADEYAKKPRPYWKSWTHMGVAWDRFNQPTHWMPLPEPPKQTQLAQPQKISRVLDNGGTTQQQQ